MGKLEGRMRVKMNNDMTTTPESSKKPEIVHYKRHTLRKVGPFSNSYWFLSSDGIKRQHASLELAKQYIDSIMG